jgi:predicted nucleotidyltransferase
MEELNQAIKKTINYGKKYKSKLTLEQLKIRLLSSKIFSDLKIENAASKYKLKKEQIKINFEVDKANKLVNDLKTKFEDILLIGLTGSVAAGSQKKNDDIDLIIITRRNRLWLTRIRWWNQLNKKGIAQRRYGVKEKKGDICSNLWLEEGALRLPIKKQNLKNAVDLVMMKPLLNRENIYERFLKQNEWVKEYVANGYQRRVKENILMFENKKTISEIMWKDLINNICFWGQYLYMKKKIIGEIVDKKRAFFHRK